MVSPINKQVRITISLSAYDLEMLQKWAETHGKSAGVYAGQIVAARIEANYSAINEQYAAYLKWLQSNPSSVDADEDLDID